MEIRAPANHVAAPSLHPLRKLMFDKLLFPSHQVQPSLSYRKRSNPALYQPLAQSVHSHTHTLQNPNYSDRRIKDRLEIVSSESVTTPDESLPANFSGLRSLPFWVKGMEGDVLQNASQAWG